MTKENRGKRHIYVTTRGAPETYTWPGRGSDTLRLPERQRRRHGTRLLEQLEGVRKQLAEQRRVRQRHELADIDGHLIAFEGEPEHGLALESLENQKAEIELLNTRCVGSRVEATVIIPHGGLKFFEDRVTSYLDEHQKTPTGKPKHRRLIESISSIRLAALEHLWTDEPDLLPAPHESIWWEVWLQGGRLDTRVAQTFLDHAAKLELEVRPEQQQLLDRTVMLVLARRAALETLVCHVTSIAELRRARAVPEDLLRAPGTEQARWSNDLIGRTRPPGRDAPALCLLDTGVNADHPLLRIALDPDDLLTCNPAWGVDDHHPQGHGTAMAGIGLYGADLADLLLSRQRLSLLHRLESVKLLPRRGSTEPGLFGLRTSEAVGRAEINAPHRCRTICSTITFEEGRDAGRPSSWSAAVDELAAGLDGAPARLIVQSAGNVPQDRWNAYPDSCDAEGIHDPGQAWNVLTVGGFTQRARLDRPEYIGWRPIAESGSLSPCSTTSLTWSKKWPFKPDVVFEAGNAAIDPATGQADTPEDLRLLTTHHNIMSRLLSVTGDTSAAAAQCARLAATLQAHYPALRPETIRALIVHSASWTEQMKQELPPTNTQNRQLLLRRYGLGVPSLERAIWSASNYLTLIIEDQLQPFRRKGSSIKMNEMKTHHLPWPSETLLQLGETPVELRVTLSYFIEPSPGRRGWTSRYTYPSHGLRFELLRPEETPTSFRKRVNKAARHEHEDRSSWRTRSDDGWCIGPQERYRGSIHSDRWQGTAADLASRDLVSIVPVSGWWKTRPKLGRSHSTARYSLVVSIHSPAETMDIYSPVEAQIAVPVTS